jgi:hypothetical protein
MTQRYETQDTNAEDCHIKNTCKKRPYSARTPPEPPSATQDSEIQHTSQKKSQRLAERQQTLAPQANEQPPKPKGKKRQRPSEYKLHNNDISYCAVQPLDPENRATSLWDYKKVCVAGTFNDPSDAFNSMYQYHLQAAKVVDHRLHVNNKRRADETEAEDQEQYLTHYEPLIIEKWALRLLKADKNRTIISTEPIARIDVEDAGCEICCDPGTREEHTEQGNLPTTDMYQCSVCNRTYHWSCLKQLQCYKEEDRINIDAQSDWSCPACHDLSLDEKEARSHASQHELLKVTWSPTWEPKELLHSWASFWQRI